MPAVQTTKPVGGTAVADIVASAKKYGLNPWVALAVATGEGSLNFGEVGDEGTSFGPFQLHIGGALPAGKTAAWANSAAGIDYAVRQIAAVSRGAGSTDAQIAAAVTNFERPAAANLSGEIARDQSWLSGQGAGGKLPLGQGTVASANDPLSSGVSSAYNAASNAAGSVLGGLDAIGNFFDKLGDPRTWINVAAVLGGSILLLLGLARLFAPVTDREKAAAGKVIRVGSGAAKEAVS